MDLLHYYATSVLGDTDDKRAIQYLGLRVFNDLAAAWQLMSTGYFQVSAMVQRDIVETVNLVNDFYYRPERISLWRTGSAEERKNLFKPWQIRKALDERMGLGPSRRGAIYAMFSTVAAHPTIEGLEMLKPRGSNDADVGPFMDEGWLRPLLVEHAMLSLQAGMAFNLFLHVETLEARTIAHTMITSMMDWMQTYKKKEFSLPERQKAESLLIPNPE